MSVGMRPRSTISYPLARAHSRMARVWVGSGRWADRAAWVRRRPTGPGGVLDVAVERLSECLGVLGAEVDGVADAVDRELDGFVLARGDLHAADADECAPAADGASRSASRSAASPVGLPSRSSTSSTIMFGANAVLELLCLGESARTTPPPRIEESRSGGEVDQETSGPSPARRRLSWASISIPLFAVALFSYAFREVISPLPGPRGAGECSPEPGRVGPHGRPHPTPGRVVTGAARARCAGAWSRR